MYHSSHYKQNNEQQQMRAGSNSNSDSNAFRPSQLIEFTAGDVSSGNNHYAPSYIATPSYGQLMLNLQAENIANRYDIEQQTQLPKEQFSFPNEQQQLTPQVFNSYNHNSYQQTTVPAALHSSPIQSYRDPYTQQNYAAATEPYILASNHGPQDAYTVQSSMQVGSSQIPKPFTYEQQAFRPGQVFDEKPYKQFNSNHKYASTTHPNSLQQLLVNSNHRELPNTLSGAGNKLSYDSHDYPPPSYANQESSNFRPTVRPSRAPARVTYNPNRKQQGNFLNSQQNNYQNYQQAQYLLQTPPAAAAANYANNYDNYLPEYAAGNYQNRPLPPQAIQNRPPIPQPPRQPPRPSYNNYYDYQLGEIPPGHAQVQPVNSITSLFGMPQFTNLLLSGLGAGGNNAGNGASALSGLFSAFTGTSNKPSYSKPSVSNNNYNRPLNMQLIKALENIARNDDLQCVPKVLCQMIAGQTQRGQLPDFITSPALTK